MENYYSMGERYLGVTSIIPAAHATDLFPSVVSNGTSHPSREKQNHIEKETHHHNHHHNNNNNGLVITECTGETQTKLAQVIARYVHTLQQRKARFLGYPTNEDLNYEALAPLLHFHLNNAGDPFLGSGFTLNSTEFEVCVLDWFANLWEIEKGHYWGYVTTGGTEGNLHGILVGREQYPDGILYTSQDSHYSIFKIARMYRMQCVKVDTLISGEIDCGHLKTLLLAHKDKPAIINLNIGTTMKGAVDDPDLVIQTLEETGFSRVTDSTSTAMELYLES